MQLNLVMLMVELLNNFKHIRMLLSIDSVGKSMNIYIHPMPGANYKIV